MTGTVQSLCAYVVLHHVQDVNRDARRDERWRSFDPSATVALDRCRAELLRMGAKQFGLGLCSRCRPCRRRCASPTAWRGMAIPAASDVGGRCDERLRGRQVDPKLVVGRVQVRALGGGVSWKTCLCRSARVVRRRLRRPESRRGHQLGGDGRRGEGRRLVRGDRGLCEDCVEYCVVWRIVHRGC